ncbi:SIR2 family protein [Methanofollis ethanolicus]|uniref:SIR2 family protein n=1 Tax=Methanofollis ethanolicus TaxID=488124 RepID=UPI000B048F9F|nr:SIR2 family protein [Methanofollis ethanolicus]
MSTDGVVPVAYAMHASPKRYALLLGAGISVAAGLPTASDVSGNMILAIARGRGEEIERGENNKVCLAWFKDTFGEPATFQRLMRELGISEENRKDGLKKFIYKTDDDRNPLSGIPTEAHRAIARLVKSAMISLIITTNFDTLMEEALKAEKVPYEVITEESDIKQMSVFPDRCRVLKVNGDFERGTLRITPEDLKNYPPAIEDYLRRIFGEYGLVICGWSGIYDTHLSRILCAADIPRRYPVFWSWKNERRVPPEVCQALLPNGINIDSADEFFKTLEVIIERFSRYEPRSTLSATAAMKKVKDALRETKPELFLPDLINEETDRVLAFLADRSRYKTDTIDGKEFYTTILREHEDVAAPLAAMVATVAQYDDDTFTDLVKDTIERLINVPPITLGFVDTKGLLRLRHYPALLVIYASGVVAVRTRHFNTLEAIVRRPMKYQYEGALREKVRYYLDINIWNVIGCCQEWITNITQKRFGTETRYQDYPYLVMYEIMQVLIPNRAVFFESLDIFEYIFGLAYLTGSIEEAIEKGEFCSSTPGPLQSRHLYLRQNLLRYQGHYPIFPLPSHVYIFLADLKQNAEGSTFFEGDLSLFEEANQNYAKGFGINPPKTGLTSRKSLIKSNCL